MVVDLRLQRAAITYISKSPYVTMQLRAALSAEIRSRFAHGADERIRAMTSAVQLRETLGDDERRLLDIACGREPDAGQSLVLDVATAWMGARGQA